MYGTLCASFLWQDGAARTLTESKQWVRLGTCGQVFYYADHDTFCVIHGDYFFISANTVSLDAIDRLLSAKLEVNQMTRVGPGWEANSSMLGRTVRFITGKGFTWRANPKHVRDMATLLELEDSKPVPTPAVKDA
jgi:hypothetical protein